jgi:transposase
MAARLNQVQVEALGEETPGARRATEVASPSAGTAVAAAPDPEVVEQASRRRFTAKYKLQVLAEADRCAPGEIGALLRREGPYSSHLTTWRRQREAGALAALTPRKRGRKLHALDAQGTRVVELEREVERLRQRLLQAETIIEVQKKSRCCWGSTRVRWRA